MTRPLAVLVAMAALVAPGFAMAQGPRPGPPQPVQSIISGGNQDQPVQIDAASLEVRDKKKTATFTGDVQVVQGDTTMKCQTLTVYYGKEVGLAANAPGGNVKPAPGPVPPTNSQNIRRIEASGGVTVVTKDQNASGDLGIYDLIEKTITLTGNVVVSQGPNVIHGERVVVNTVTGNARVEASGQGGGTSSNRVRALIQTNHEGGSGNFMTIGPGH
jgi:lipopolysaccharide export system protein LptA